MDNDEKEIDTIVVGMPLGDCVTEVASMARCYRCLLDIGISVETRKQLGDRDFLALCGECFQQSPPSPADIELPSPGVMREVLEELSQLDWERRS